jgi:hypothetical protein
MRKGRKGSTNCIKIKEGKEAMLSQRLYTFFISFLLTLRTEDFASFKTMVIKLSVLCAFFA